MTALPREQSSPTSTTNPTLSKTIVRAVGKCRILADLGAGGMANVYLAVTEGQAGVNKLVVLKALRADLAAEADAVAMFTDEARLAAQLNHPNVVQTYEVGRHNGRYVMVMEYLEGQSLSRVMKEAHAQSKPLLLQLLLKIVIAALDGLHYAHELTSYQGQPLELVHRDISPQNIFVTYEGQVKVLDFGIAKAASSSTHTAAGVIKGKFAYMAPEQMTGELVDRRADIYSVGCTLWAFAVGRKLWSGIPDVQVMRRVLDGEIPSPSSANPKCDEELSRIIEKCLERECERRYATALELQADLERYCERLEPRVSQRSIGQVVSELFADSRTDMRRLIETQLSNLGSEQETLPALGFVDDSSGSERLVQSRVTEQKPRSSGRWLAIAGVLAVLGLGLWFARSRLAPEAAPVPAVSPPSPSPKEEPAVAPNATARIEFRVSPAGAKLFLDGAELSAGASSALLPVNGVRHTLRAEASGYDSATLGFTVTGDALLDLALSEIAAPSKTKPRAQRPVVSKPASPARPPAVQSAPAKPAAKPAAPDCSNPFFIDADGIKRVRADCR